MRKKGSMSPIRTSPSLPFDYANSNSSIHDPCLLLSESPFIAVRPCRLLFARFRTFTPPVSNISFHHCLTILIPPIPTYAHTIISDVQNLLPISLLCPRFHSCVIAIARLDTSYTPTNLVTRHIPSWTNNLCKSSTGRSDRRRGRRRIE